MAERVRSGRETNKEECEKKKQKERRGSIRKEERKRRTIAAATEGWSRTTTFPRTDLDSSASFFPLPLSFPLPPCFCFRAPMSPPMTAPPPRGSSPTGPKYNHRALIRVQPRVANRGQNMDPP